MTSRNDACAIVTLLFERLLAFYGRREVRSDAMPIAEYFAASALIVLITLAVAALVQGF